MTWHYLNISNYASSLNTLSEYLNSNAMYKDSHVIGDNKDNWSEYGDTRPPDVLVYPVFAPSAKYSCKYDIQKIMGSSTTIKSYSIKSRSNCTVSDVSIVDNRYLCFSFTPSSSGYVYVEFYTYSGTSQSGTKYTDSFAFRACTSSGYVSFSLDMNGGSYNTTNVKSTSINAIRIITDYTASGNATYGDARVLLSNTFISPTRTNCTLKEWNSNSLGTGTSYNIGTVVISSATTAYAVWNTTVKITTSGSGSVSSSSVTAVVGTSITSSYDMYGGTATIGSTTVTATPSGDTYKCTGWTNASGTVTPAKSITASFAARSGPYNITIKSGNTTYGKVTNSSGSTYIRAYQGDNIVASGSTVYIYTSTANSSTRGYSTAAVNDSNKYIFVDWTNASGTVSGTKTITANFDYRKYTITFTTDGGNISTTGGEYKYNSTASCTAQTTSGYRFLGWYQGSTQLQTGTNLSKTVTGDATYTAKWVETTDVTIGVVDGGGYVSPSSFSAVDVNTIFTISGNEFRITGKSVCYANNYANYEFKQWRRVSDNTVLSSGYTGYITKTNNAFLAEFKEVFYRYTLGFNPNSDNGGPSDIDTGNIHDSTYTFSIPNVTPTRDGYRFVGWADYDVSTTTVVCQPGGSWGPFNGNKDSSLNKRLIAVWQRQSPVVLDSSSDTPAWYGGSINGQRAYAFNVDQGTSYSINNSASVRRLTIGSSNYTATADSGYTFNSWSYSASSATSGTITSTSVTTFTAYFNANPYTVTYNTNGGTLPSGTSSSKVVVYHNTYGTLPTPTRGNFEFLGWYTSATGGTQVTSSTIVDKAYDHTLYAHWNAAHITFSLTQDSPSSSATFSNTSLDVPLNCKWSIGYSTLSSTCTFSFISEGSGGGGSGTSSSDPYQSLSKTVEDLLDNYTGSIYVVTNCPVSIIENTDNGTAYVIESFTADRGLTRTGDCISGTITGTSDITMRWSIYDESSAELIDDGTLTIHIVSGTPAYSASSTATVIQYYRFLNAYNSSNPSAQTGTITADTTFLVKTEMVSATSLTVTPNTLSLGVGQTDSVTSTVLPNYASPSSNWVASNTNVSLSSNSGSTITVTGVEVGVSRITATSVTPSHKDATVSVTVYIQYSLTYDVGSGSGNVPSQSSQSTENYVAFKIRSTLPTPPSGYSFVGWSWTQNATTPDFVYSNKFSPASAILYSDTPSRTLYAVYATIPEDSPYREIGGAVQVFDPSTGSWKSADDAPFIIVFDANGGEFTRATGSAPLIKLTSCTKKDGNGKVTDITVPMQEYYGDPTDPTDMGGEAYYVSSPPDGRAPYYLWALSLEECTEATLKISNLPTTRTNGGIKAPSGFSTISKWEMIAPYHRFDISNNVSSTYEIKLNRSTVDNVRQTTVEPYWTPSRDGNLRAIAVATGLGSLDFGAIQAVNTTYNSKLTVIPIVCYGYTGTFCMDLGVSKTVSISYLRVSPENPDNDSFDSRRWDNATWVRKLKEFMNRWQLRTNGCTLYLKRPDSERLSDGLPGYYDPSSVDYKDPMRNYIEEINGENCYITSAPVKYAVGKPHVIENNVSFTMGTLYPKQTPINMIQVILKWGEGTDYLPYRDIFLQYPTGTAAIAPSIPYVWTPILYDDVYKYASRLYYYADDTDHTQPRIYLTNGSYFTPYDQMVIYAELAEYNESNQEIKVTPGSYSFKVEHIEGAEAIVISMLVVGGGGGGGAAIHRKTPQSISGYVDYGSGGAGGASGQYVTTSNSPSSASGDILVEYTVGTGGNGGISSSSNSNDITPSEDGTDSYVLIAGGEVLRALGGAGGPDASSSTSPGIWSNYTEVLDSCKGGDGGSANYTITGSANDGTVGTCPSGQSNAGAAGSKNIITGTYIDIYWGGGGGGGGAVSIPGQNTAFPKGGSGQLPQNNTAVDGTFGSGGGGGCGSNNGGRGGDGVVFITVQNGIIKERN